MINLVDLAGSEKAGGNTMEHPSKLPSEDQIVFLRRAVILAQVKQTGAEGERMKEGDPWPQHRLACCYPWPQHRLACRYTWLL